MSGHQGFVLGVGFSPDDARLYSGSIEGDVHVWDPARKVRLEVWQGCHRGPILSLAVAPNGQVLTAGLDGSVGLWSRDGELVHQLTGHDGGVHGIAISDQLIASASADRRIRLWHRRTGELARTLEGHDETVTCLAFLDSQRLLSGSRDRTVRLWDVGGTAPPKVFAGHNWWVTKVAAVAGGRFVSTSEDCTLRVWDPEQSEALWTFGDSPGPIWGLAVDPKGETAIVDYGGDTYAVDLNSRSSSGLPNSAPVSSRAMSFSSDGSLLAMGHDHGDVNLLDLSGADRSGKLAGNGYPVLSGVARADLLATGKVSGAVKSISASGGVTEHGGHDFFTYCCRGLSDDLFASGGFDQKVRLWQPGTEENVASVEHGGLIFGLDWDRESGRLMASGWDRISVFALPDLTPLWRLEAGGIGNHLVSAFATEGRIAGVGEAPLLKVWADGREVASHRLPDAHNCVIESVPGESLVAVGSAYGRVSLVDVGSGDSQPLHGEHEDWIRVLRVSGDGRRVFSASQNGSARVYDRRLGQVTDRFDCRPIAIGDFDSDDRLHWLDCLGVAHAEPTAPPG